MLKMHISPNMFYLGVIAVIWCMAAFLCWVIVTLGYYGLHDAVLLSHSVCSSLLWMFGLLCSCMYCPCCSVLVLLTWWYVVIMVRLMLGGNDLMRALGVQWLVCCSCFLVD